MYQVALRYLIRVLQIEKFGTKEKLAQASTYLNISAVLYTVDRCKDSLEYALRANEIFVEHHETQMNEQMKSLIAGCRHEQAANIPFRTNLVVSYYNLGVNLERCCKKEEAYYAFCEGYHLSSMDLGINHALTKSLRLKLEGIDDKFRAKPKLPDVSSHKVIWKKKPPVLTSNSKEIQKKMEKAYLSEKKIREKALKSGPGSVVPLKISKDEVNLKISGKSKGNRNRSGQRLHSDGNTDKPPLKERYFSQNKAMDLLAQVVQTDQKIKKTRLRINISSSLHKSGNSEHVSRKTKKSRMKVSLGGLEEESEGMEGEMEVARQVMFAGSREQNPSPPPGFYFTSHKQKVPIEQTNYYNGKPKNESHSIEYQKEQFKTHEKRNPGFEESIINKKNTTETLPLLNQTINNKGSALIKSGEQALKKSETLDWKYNEKSNSYSPYSKKQSRANIFDSVDEPVVIQDHQSEAKSDRKIPLNTNPKSVSKQSSKSIKEEEISRKTLERVTEPENGIEKGNSLNEMKSYTYPERLSNDEVFEPQPKTAPEKADRQYDKMLSHLDRFYPEVYQSDEQEEEQPEDSGVPLVEETVEAGQQEPPSVKQPVQKYQPGMWDKHSTRSMQVPDRPNQMKIARRTDRLKTHEVRQQHESGVIGRDQSRERDDLHKESGEAEDGSFTNRKFEEKRKTESIPREEEAAQSSQNNQRSKSKDGLERSFVEGMEAQSMRSIMSKEQKNKLIFKRTELSTHKKSVGDDPLQSYDEDGAAPPIRLEISQIGFKSPKYVSDNEDLLSQDEPERTRGNRESPVVPVELKHTQTMPTEAKNKSLAKQSTFVEGVAITKKAAKPLQFSEHGENTRPKEPLKSEDSVIVIKEGSGKVSGENVKMGTVKSKDDSRNLKGGIQYKEKTIEMESVKRMDSNKKSKQDLNGDVEKSGLKQTATVHFEDSVGKENRESVKEDKSIKKETPEKTPDEGEANLSPNRHSNEDDLLAKSLRESYVHISAKPIQPSIALPDEFQSNQQLIISNEKLNKNKPVQKMSINNQSKNGSVRSSISIVVSKPPEDRFQGTAGHRNYTSSHQEISQKKEPNSVVRVSSRKSAELAEQEKGVSLSEEKSDEFIF